MTRHSQQWLLAVLILAATAGGAELSKIDRTIGRQPEYQSQPKYALLVFGPEAATRVWIVVDGNVVYIDRNANGNLLEEGERFVASAGSYEAFVNVPSIVQDKGTEHTNLGLYLQNNYRFRMNIRTGGQLLQHVGLGPGERPMLADAPRLAPVIHFGGPLTFAPYGGVPALEPESSGSRQASLRLLLGTQGWGVGTFAAVRCVTSSLEPASGKPYDLTLQPPRYILTQTRSPKAVLEYLSREAWKIAQTEVQPELKSRCGLVFDYGPVAIPSDAAAGPIQVKLAYPDSADGPIAPATVPILVK
jgi:hypothetical protein